MPELRWALIGLGAAFLVGLALWEWRRSRRRPARSAPEPTPAIQDHVERPRRIEPSIDGMVANRRQTAEEPIEVPTIHPVGPEAVPVAVDAAVDIPAAARAPDTPPQHAAIRWPPERSDRVLSLRVVGSRGDTLPGRQLRIALEAAGLVPGPQTIYHRITEDGSVLVSVANLVRPGSLEPARMDAQQYRGLSLFSILPGPLAPEAMLDELVAVARSLAQRVDGLVQDERGADLDADRLLQLRQSLGEPSGVGTSP